MKVSQISGHIWSLKAWVLIPVHVWVVVEEDGVTLVDAGIPQMANGIMKLIDQIGAGPLKRIVLTHGHSDHVGAVKRILKSNPVPVYAHAIEIPFMEGDLPYPRRKKAGAFVEKGIAQPLPADASGQLQPIGGLTPYLAPGHSPGHVVFWHEEDRILLAGDLFTSKKGKLHRPMPMFTADMDEAIQSSRIVGQLRPFRLEICHGATVFNPADHLEEYMASAPRQKKHA